MKNSRIRRVTAGIVVSSVIFTGVGAASALASADVARGPSATQDSVFGTAGGLTSAQWQAIARASAAAGDNPAARAAQRMATDLGRGVQARSIIWTLAKPLIKAALKYGKDALPSVLRPWAGKILGAIEKIESLTELGITTALINAGLPADVARTAAQWIATFL